MEISSNSVIDNLRRANEPQPKTPDNGRLTQQDFFRLLTTELAQQDPTKPADNNEIISQMTAFSTTSGVEELNKSFTQFANSQTSNQALQASSLVGRNVQVKDNTFGLAEGASAQGKLITDKPASNVFIYVEDQAGNIVQTVPVGNVKAGEFGFVWDGKNADGKQAPEGAYRFRIAGLVEGKASELEARTYRKVDSVTLRGAGGGVVLNLNGGSSIALSDVVEVADS